MKLNPKASGAMTIVEMLVTGLLIGVLGLVVYSLLNIGTVLGAKNIAVNTAHEQARTAMLQMVQDLHSSVSLPALADVDGNPLPSPTPGATAPGIAFQLWAIGPLQIAADAAAGQNVVKVTVPAGTQAPVQPVAGTRLQRLIVRTHQLEDDITAVSPPNIGTAGGTVSLTLVNNLPVPPDGTNIYIKASSNHIICFITDRCSYAVKNGALDWRGPTTKKAFSVMGNGITNPTPFSVKTTKFNAPLYQFVATFDLTAADMNYTNRGFKSVNILLRGEVPMRARLTDSQ